jgi:RimJ/RimL family protein N-acetyltransferase
MLDTNLFHGSLVRLTAEDPEPAAKFLAQTARDSEYTRLLDTDPRRMWSATKIQSWIENDLGNRREDFYYFLIRSLAEDRLIGFLNLYALSGQHGDTWLGIGLGDRSYWGKGYGTDAVRVILRYAFSELNLRRVSLAVFAYNERAVKAYQKAGFQEEGRLRRYIARDGQRHDYIVMGVLREEWHRVGGEYG